MRQMKKILISIIIGFLIIIAGTVVNADEDVYSYYLRSVITDDLGTGFWRIPQWNYDYFYENADIPSNSYMHNPSIFCIQHGQTAPRFRC